MTETPVAPPAFATERTSGCPFDPPPARSRLLGDERISRVSLWDGSTAWLISGHAEQVALLRDDRVSADVLREGYPTINAASKVTLPHTRSFVGMDDPEHAGRRRQFTADFTLKRMRTLAPRVQGIIDTLLDAMEQAGPPADLVSAFALPLPSLVICELLGVPYEDHDFFQRASSTMLNIRSTAEESLAASQSLLDYLAELVEAKAADPGDDLLSRQATQYLSTGQRTREDCAKDARLLLVAGHETTANMIALGTCALLQNPGQLAAVRDGDEQQVAGAVEELLRYLSIVHLGRRRVAKEDIEIGGQLIRAGEGIICATDTANRDPDAFPEPDTLDVGRHARGHIAFGTGVHQCLGQNLARIELQLAYPALLHRFPGLRLDRPLAEIPFRDEMAVYGVHELPVAW